MTFASRSAFALLLPILAACTTGSTSNTTGSGGSTGSAASTTSGHVCSDGSTSASSGSSQPQASSDLLVACESLFEQRIPYAKACTGTPDAASERASFVTLCVAVATATGSLVTIADIDACTATVASASCTADATYPACTGGLALLFPKGDKKGSSPPGAACIAGLQCDSGHCDAFGGLCGKCQRGRSVGETCSNPGDVCESSTCLQGGKCGSPGTGAGTKCFQYGGTSDCGPGLACATIEGFEGEGFCAPRGQSGDVCKATFQCEDGLFCDGARCAPRLADAACCSGTKQDECLDLCVDGACRKRGFSQTEGQSCQFDECEAGLLCDGMICTSQAFLALGDTCWSGSAYTGACSPDLICDIGCDASVCATPRTCVNVPAIGAPCVAFGQCGPGASCVGFNSAPASAGVCTKEGHENEPCPCAEGLVCSAGKCLTFGPALCQ